MIPRKTRFQQRVGGMAGCRGTALWIYNAENQVIDAAVSTIADFAQTFPGVARRVF